MKHETLNEAGYQYVIYDDGYHILYDVHTKTYERWRANIDHGSYGLKYRNTVLEFCSSLSVEESLELSDSIRRMIKYHPEMRGYKRLVDVYHNYILQ